MGEVELILNVMAGVVYGPAINASQQSRRGRRRGMTHLQ
jgi:hypothetical protein